MIHGNQIITRTYDAVVIGAGQSGGPLASALANEGWHTALIERKYVGGTCINRGCTPTKALIASATTAHLARNSDKYGIHTGAVSVSFPEVQKRKNHIVESFREGSRESYENTENLDLLMGEATFTTSNSSDKHMLSVRSDNGKFLSIETDTVFINTGTHATIPQIEGIEDIEYLDSTSILELDHLPEHLAILGGGNIGIEFAQMFRRFGSAITVIEMSDQILPDEDDDISNELMDILRDEDIDIRLNSALTKVEKMNGQVRLSIETPDGENKIDADNLLIAIGRTPNTKALNLENVGIHTDEKGYITVTESLKTNISGIYAMGDVKGGPAFTHISYDDFRVLKDNILNDGDETIADRLVSYVLYTEPQLGRIGLTEQQARERNLDYRVARLAMSSVARAIEVDKTQGLMKVIIDANTNQILGCAILGSQGGELMSILQVAMIGNLPFTRLRDAIFAHPTYAESLNNLFSNVE